ncbi:MAG: GNAT family N-acetyltransferase [Ginsengibacter sp.]
MLSIRSAGFEDLQLIQKLAYEIWPSAYSDILATDQLAYMLDKIYSLSSLQHQFAILKHTFILAFENGNATGFASYSANENSDAYHLHKIYVLPQQQGNGTGKFILNKIIESIRSAGANSLDLNVNRYNKAKTFYERLGFKIMKETDIDIGHGYYMNDYIMKLEL